MNLSPDFDPVSAAAGGVLIGLAASAMMLGLGRVAGISGIYGGLLHPKAGDVSWRLAFLGGLLLTGLVASLCTTDLIVATDTRSLATTAAAGLVVGVGVRIGNGCTSGHGVCGLARFSRRSLVATVTFLATGVATATIIQMLFGGVA